MAEIKDQLTSAECVKYVHDKLKRKIDSINRNIQNHCKRSKNEFNCDSEFTAGLYINSSFTVLANSQGLRTYVFTITSGKRYVINWDRTILSDTSLGIVLVTTNKSAVEVGDIYSGRKIFNNNSTQTDITAGIDDTYMILNLQSSSVYDDSVLNSLVKSVCIEQIDAGYETSGLPYYIVDVQEDNLSQDVKKKLLELKWNEKNIWWCGTSIPEGKDTALNSESICKSYPQIVGEILGATVHNVALGSSMCRANTRFGDYTDGLSYNVMRALTATIQEKQDLIDNWETYRKALRDPDTYTSLSDSIKADILNSSFENKLIPYLDGTYTMPDLFVIDHGHNDYKYTLSDGSSDITLEPTVNNIESGVLANDSFMSANSSENLSRIFGDLSNIRNFDDFVASVNRNCYIGAVNFLCTIIFKYNPRARIVFISNYEDFSKTELITAQNYNANSWQFPLIEVWKRLGFNNHVIPGTINYWGVSGDGYTGYDLTAKQIYFKDDVHPHSDSNGVAIHLYASVIADELKHCF